MTLPGMYQDSDQRCPRDGKRLVMEIGQDAETGWVHEHHWCLNCEYSVRERPRANKTVTVLSVAELLRRRVAHLDRGVEVEHWLGTMSDSELEEIAGEVSS